MKVGSVVGLSGDAMCAVREMSSGIEGLCVRSELWRPWHSLCISRDVELSSISTRNVNKRPVPGRKEGIELPREDAPGARFKRWMIVKTNALLCLSATVPATWSRKPSIIICVQLRSYIPRTLSRSLIQALLLAENLSKGSLNESQGWPGVRH
jgi:hypothetical protein